MIPTFTDPGVEDIRVGVADLLIAIQEAHSVDDCLRLAKLASSLSLEVQLCEDAANDKADALNGSAR